MKNQADLDALEGKSLYAIFQYLLGNKEAELEKAKQEYLAGLYQIQFLDLELRRFTGGKVCVGEKL